MTVKELISLLSLYPENHKVVLGESLRLFDIKATRIAVVHKCELSKTFYLEGVSTEGSPPIEVVILE